MRTCIALLALAASAYATGPEPQAIAPRKKIAVFNGRNLEGWYTWLRENKYEDPKKVFSVANRMIKISGEEWGGLTTKNAYRDYHLTVEWKWGGPAHGDRATKARDSGILVHGSGEDGGYSGTWLESIESQVIEGGCGDFIVVAGKVIHPSLTAEVREGDRGETFWQKGGKVVTRQRGRFNWYGRDPQWKDQLGFRGRQDVEKPVGDWNVQEVIADGDTLTNIVNGVVVNRATGAKPSQGKLQIQSEGAEIWIRKVELRPAK